MGICHVEVVIDHWDSGDDVVDVRASRCFPPAVGEQRSYPQLRNCDGGDRNVVVVIDDLVKVVSAPRG